MIGDAKGVSESREGTTKLKFEVVHSGEAVFAHRDVSSKLDKKLKSVFSSVKVALLGDYAVLGLVSTTCGNTSTEEKKLTDVSKDGHSCATTSHLNACLT